MINGIMATASQAQLTRADHDGKKGQFKALETAIQSGDLTAAQKAYESISATASKNDSQTNPVAKVFASLGQALQAGDMTGAQKAFATLQQTMHNRRPHMTPSLSNPTPGGDPDGDGDGASATAMPSPNLNISA